MREISSILLLLTLSFGSCEKSDIAENTPNCIMIKIEGLKKSSICNDPSIKEYRFQTKVVYVVDPGTCGADMSAGVFDNNCEEIGELGGITGNTIINGEEFSNAQFIRLIWKK